MAGTPLLAAPEGKLLEGQSQGLVEPAVLKIDDMRAASLAGQGLGREMAALRGRGTQDERRRIDRLTDPGVRRHRARPENALVGHET